MSEFFAVMESLPKGFFFRGRLFSLLPGTVARPGGDGIPL